MPTLMERRDPPPAPEDGTRSSPLPLPLLIAAFVLSGAAGLIYESVWSRYLGLFVGHGAYAQVIVLVIFIGGMAAGALAVSARSSRIADPLRAYAAIEALIGILGLLFHPAFTALTDLAYRSWFPAIGESAALQMVKWGLSALLILPASVLLGATFPLMAAGVARRRPRQTGRIVALLYFANSLGAAGGVLAAGFWLVSVGGLRGTLATAAALNLIVALGVWSLARRGSVAPLAPRNGGEKPAAEGAPAWLPRLMIAVSFGTAVASFVYEIAWVRMLSLVLGSATHSFELMLSAFILGLALGALWLQRRADRIARPIEVLAVTQWVMGALALATLPLYAGSFQWMASLVRGLQPAPNGYEAFSLARYAICLAVMLPATVCAGVTLPLLTRIRMRSGGERAIGAVYGANTLGSIVGAALAALVLLPWLGLERLLATGAAIDIALGVALLASAERPETRRRAFSAAVAGALVVFGITSAVKLDPLRLVSGVYRYGHLFTRAESQVIWYHDGRTATVSVRLQPDGSLTLATNGKPDASLGAFRLHPDTTRAPEPLTSDESTQLLLGLVSLAHARDARQAAVIGMGSGMTSHVLLGSARLERVVTIEIEPDMLRAAQLFRPANDRVFADPRSTFVIDDARSYFSASRARFDLIVSEPSNPWVSGVSGLFTDEFYRRVKSSLTERGVLGQWLHLYSLDDDLVLGVLAGLHRNFRDFHIYMVSPSDCLILASDRPQGLVPDWGVTGEPGIARDLARTPPLTAEQLDATWVTDRAALAPLLDRTPPNSDFVPRLDLGAERARFRNTMATGLLRLHADRFTLASAHGPRLAPLSTTHLALEPVPRLVSLLENLHFRRTREGQPVLVDSNDARRLFGAVERSRRVLAPGRVDPHLWLADALLTEDDLHRGTGGWVDQDFFAALDRITRAGRAPHGVRVALDWMKALEARDYRRASALTDSVIALSIAEGRPWVDPSLILDGGCTAKLAVGDVAGARRVALACGVGDRPTGDLRTRLIQAWVAAK
jgi:predicted membrane-bound spermidine synthase